jgi:hypothetical protein
VADLNESDCVGALPQRFHDSIDAISRQAEDDFNAPVHQALNKNVRSSLLHVTTLIVGPGRNAIVNLRGCGEYTSHSMVADVPIIHVRL